MCKFWRTMQVLSEILCVTLWSSGPVGRLLPSSVVSIWLLRRSWFREHEYKRLIPLPIIAVFLISLDAIIVDSDNKSLRRDHGLDVTRRAYASLAAARAEISGATRLVAAIHLAARCIFSLRIRLCLRRTGMHTIISATALFPTMVTFMKRIETRDDRCSAPKVNSFHSGHSLSSDNYVRAVSLKVR